MVSRSFLLLAFVAIYLYPAESKIYGVCELVYALKQQGIPQDQLPTWVCIAKFESAYNTQAINQQTGDYGIFQISHYFWCNDGDTPGKGCDITCQSLLEDDITEDIVCIQKVYEETARTTGQNGFTAWTTYNATCQYQNNLPDISNC